jgi:hypothetical protein
MESSFSNEVSFVFSFSSLLDAGASTDVDIDPWERDDDVVLVDAIPDFLVVLVLLVPALALMVAVEELRVRPVEPEVEEAVVLAVDVA